jgi:hypothetical protein
VAGQLRSGSPVRPAAAVILASSSSPDTASVALVSSACALRSRAVAGFPLRGAGGGGAVAAELEQLLQSRRGLERGIQEDVVLGGARVGLDRGQAGDDRHRAGGEMEHRVGHPVVRRGVQGESLGLGDLLGADAAFDRDRSAASALASATPTSALASRSRTSASGSLPRPTSSPRLNVFDSSACSCATSSTTAWPSGAPVCMAAKATVAGARPARVTIFPGAPDRHALRPPGHCGSGHCGSAMIFDVARLSPARPARQARAPHGEKANRSLDMSVAALVALAVLVVVLGLPVVMEQERTLSAVTESA